MRTAVKAGIPHVDDPISKLHSLGVMTQGKLADIASAAAASGIYDLVPPLNSVSTGMRRLPANPVFLLRMFGGSWDFWWLSRRTFSMKGFPLGCKAHKPYTVKEHKPWWAGWAWLCPLCWVHSCYALPSKGAALLCMLACQLAAESHCAGLPATAAHFASRLTAC